MTVVGRGARVKRDLSGFVQWSPSQQRRLLLWLCLATLLSITIFPHDTAFGHYAQRRAYQESPLSPLATPLTATVTTTLPATESLSTPLTTSLTTPLTMPASVVVSVPLTVPVTAPVTGQVTSPLTVPAPAVATTSVPPTATAALEIAAPTATLVNHGQVSLLLVGAVLASLVVVIAVVIGRRR